MRGLSLALIVLACNLLQGCVPAVAVGAGAAGVLMVNDRRAKDVYLHDQRIETEAFQRIDKRIKGLMHVNVTSFNYIVLVSGEVPEESTKTEIGSMVSEINMVRNVHNELAVTRSSSLASRSNDSLITSNVKLRFMHDKQFNPEHIKVVTENGTVYLMGIVKRAEGEAAAEIASTSKGVQSVVKLFEYLD